jgi:hypothetical protein
MAVAAAIDAFELRPTPHAAKIGAGKGMSFASFRRFWVVAANRNSSLAPRPAPAQSVELQDALQMSEEHLDPLSLAARDRVGLPPAKSAPSASVVRRG